MFRTLSVFSDLYGVIRRYLQHESNDHQMLMDPLSTLARLAIFSEKPSGTKMSISDYTITFHDVQALQGTIRKLNGDQRDDLHYLYQPIMMACRWYSHQSELRPVFEMALRGLNKLEKLYQDSPVIGQCLTLYEKTIYKALEDASINLALLERSTLLESNDLTVDWGNTNTLKSIWTTNRIKVLVSLFDEFRQCQDRDDLRHPVRHRQRDRHRDRLDEPRPRPPPPRCC